MEPNAHQQYWIEKLREGALAFNQAQERVPYGEWINLDGADLREIDVRGCCFKRASMFDVCFANESQIASARLSDPLMDNPKVPADLPPKPTNRVYDFSNYRRVADTRSSSAVLETYRDDAAHGRG